MPYIVPDYIHEPLYVVAVVYDPLRFKARWKRYVQFAQHVKDSGAVLITVEAAFGDRHHALQEGEDQYGNEIFQEARTKETAFKDTRSTKCHQYIKVRTPHEIWLKENLINIGISRLPEDWKYVAWIDADVLFARPNWVGETIHQLQHYKVVQMWSECQDVGPRYSGVGPLAKSFMYCHINQMHRGGAKNHYYYGPPSRGGTVNWHPGYAWAARREAIDELGGLVDFAIMGAADNHMAHALVGKVEESYHPQVSPSYKEKLLEWQNRANTYIRCNVGFVSGLLVHYWHGRKVDRHYWDRWKVIVENQYNPNLDIKYGAQGVLQLVDRGEARSVSLRDDARRSFRSRNEDDISLTGTADHG